MNETWWVNPAALDDEQKAVLKAAPEADLLITGPPGSGKTNILILRANYVRSVAPRLLFITFTRTLAEFLRSGPNIGREDQIKHGEILTFMGWGMRLLHDHGCPIPDSTRDFDKDRDNLLSAISEMIDAEQPGKLYDVVFIDEVQDFYDAELQILRRLSLRINAAGDSRQAIWQHKEGLPSAKGMVSEIVDLKKHYRIGRRICQFADRILPPKLGDPPMIEGANYDEDLRPSSVIQIGCSDLDDQCEACLEELKKQTRYINDEPIAVLALRGDVRDRFWDFIADDPDLADMAILQRSDGYQPFGPDSLIRVMTVASAKGSECRAMHLLCAEEFGTNRRELAFTAVTRAKTEVILYHTDALPGHMQPPAEALPDIDDIF
jgi:superfamily I DNA and RNA helicase